MASRITLSLAWVLAACSASGRDRAALDAAQMDPADAQAVEGEPSDRAPSDQGARDAGGSDAEAPPADALQPAAQDAASSPEASAQPAKQAWPSADAPLPVDQSGAFSNNLSALGYEPARASSPARLWALQNEPPTLFRLLWDGALWKSDAAEGWARGKLLRFPNSGGRPDTEGLALLPAADGVRFVYMATERDADSLASHPSVLRFDVSASGAALTATHEWNLSSAIPQTGLNMGLEAIAFVPDAAAAGLLDESRARAYEPDAYGEHAGGLFFVGVESTGKIHAFVLDHADGNATRVASMDSGMPGVMALEYDADNAFLWAHCDDACGNLTTVLELDRGSGHFVVRRELEAPTGTEDLGNEGLAIAPDAECSDGRKSIFWAEDVASGGRAIRRGTLPCGRSW